MESLRAWRHTLGEDCTLEAAGRLLGVSAVQMSRYETGARRVPAERVSQISRITGISPHILRPDVFAAPVEAAE